MLSIIFILIIIVCVVHFRPKADPNSIRMPLPYGTYVPYSNGIWRAKILSYQAVDHHQSLFSNINAIQFLITVILIITVRNLFSKLSSAFFPGFYGWASALSSSYAYLLVGQLLVQSAG